MEYLIEEKIISEDVIKEPIDKLIVKGTKEVPKTMATGAFMMPTRGRFTSGYGQRWGRMHQGIDIAATEGTPIYAADGGVVTHSGWQGSYGYMVEIDHENVIYFDDIHKLVDTYYDAVSVKMVNNKVLVTLNDITFEAN